MSKPILEPPPLMDEPTRAAVERLSAECEESVTIVGVRRADVLAVLAALSDPGPNKRGPSEQVEAMAYILTKHIERGDSVTADDISAVAEYVQTPRPPITDEDREWAINWLKEHKGEIDRERACLASGTLSTRV